MLSYVFIMRQNSGYYFGVYVNNVSYEFVWPNLLFSPIVHQEAGQHTRKNCCFIFHKTEIKPVHIKLVRSQFSCILFLLTGTAIKMFKMGISETLFFSFFFFANWTIQNKRYRHQMA